MRRMPATILTLSSIIIIYGCYYFGLPYALNKPKVANFVQTQALKTTGYKIAIENLRFKSSYFPAIRIYADNFYILNDDNSKALTVANPYVKIRLLPLILKEIKIAALNSDNIEAQLVFDKNSKLKLGQYPLVKKDNDFHIVGKNFNIKKYKINLFDEIQKKTIVLDGNFFNLGEFNQDKQIRFSTDAQLHTGEKFAKINADIDLQLPLKNLSEDKALLDLDIQNLDLSDFKIYAKALSHNKITDLRGIINIKTHTKNIQGHRNIIGRLNLDNFGIIQKDAAASIYSKYPLNIKGDISVIKNGFKINNLKLLSHNIDIFMNGRINKTNAKFPILDLKATINKASGAELLPLFPGDENLNPDFNFYKLKKYGIYGNATGNIEIKGEADYPNLYGNALLTDVYLIEPIKDAPKNGVIKLNFNQHEMNLNAHVFTNKNEYVDVLGKFKLFRNRYTDLYIKSTENIELVKVRKVVMPLHEIFKFELGPIPMMRVDAGIGSANLHIAGTKTEPHSWGKINFRDGIASFITINNMVAKKIAGSVNFDNEIVTFKTTSTYLNNLPVDIDGNCTLSGDLSVNVKGEGQNSKDLLKIINTSPILAELQQMMKPITFADGKTKIFLNIFGHVNRGEEPVFNKDLFAKGTVELINNKMTFFEYKIPASNISGIIHFDRDDGDFNITANLLNSPISTNGVIKKQTVTANAVSHKFIAEDGLKIARLMYGNKIPAINIPGLNTIHTSFSGHYQGPMDLEHFDYNKITAKGKIYSNFGSKSPLLVNNSEFEVKNSNVKTSVIRGAIKRNPYNLQLDIDRAFDEKKLVSGTFSMKDFDLSVLNGLKIPEIPNFKDFTNFQGKINISSKIKNNNIRLFSQLGDTSVIYKPKHLRIKILNGNILFDKDDLNLNKINAYAGVMPVFVNGKISNIVQNPDLNLYVNAKPSQEFFDQFFNSKSVYPIKLKGDVMFSSTLRGTLDRLSSKTELKLDESSSLYYMGATIGDLTNPVRIYIDGISSPTSLRLNNFVYDKIIASQNNKRFPNTQVTAKGDIYLLGKNNLRFKNFKVKTENPTDAKIFNIIFKKPFMKQGVFTSDLLINGDLYTPKILGKLDVTSVDIPVFDTTVKDVSLDFRHDNVYIRTKSSVLDNAIYFAAIMQNKFIPPYTFKDVSLYFEDLDLNKITNAIQEYEADLYKQQLGLTSTAKAFDPSQIIVKSGKILADNIKIKELKATDFKADFNIDKNTTANVNDYNFKLANGSVNGDLSFNLLTNELDLNSHIHNSNAQTIGESLFDMKGQFYGIVNGDMNIKCIGKDQAECLKTLSGKGQFLIKDGRMPKLGSLEYLLKASNLVTGGITGISINGIIDLITPLKTGEFKSIAGHYNIENGIVRDLEVFSKGKDLNLYLTGSYNIENYIADMEVYGSLSSNIASVFGKIKSLSLNTLLNTIPLLQKNELSDDITAKINKIPANEQSSISRIFAVDINGDINGLNYVKSFKWVK